MYLHQALVQPDRQEFIKAMVKEIQTHQDRKHWAVTPIEKVPKGTKILDSIWAMRRKRKIGTGKISKYKARLSAHGGQQEYGINYWETFAPVVQWTTIRLIMTLTMILDWHTRQLDFVLAYPQAEVEGDIYMKLPKGFSLTEGRSSKTQIAEEYIRTQAGRKSLE